jgi:hypothetical protein
MANTEARFTLAKGAARQPANAAKTRAQWGGISRRWLVPLLQWRPVAREILGQLRALVLPFAHSGRDASLAKLIYRP